MFRVRIPKQLKCVRPLPKMQGKDGERKMSDYTVEIKGHTLEYFDDGERMIEENANG